MTAAAPTYPASPEWDRLGIVPGRTMRAFGMRRSGNHAIIDWVQRNAPDGKSVFLNNCRAGRTPLGNFSGIEVNGGFVAQRKAMRNMPAFTAAAGNGALFMFSYEDVSPAEFQDPRRISGEFDSDLIDCEVLIYRSFLNWVASLLKKVQGNPGFSLSRRCAIVLQTIERYGRLLSLIDAPAEGKPIIGICYDRWFSNAAYRLDLLTRLGLSERDNSVGTVQRYGGGSSFQKDAADASELDTAARWLQMAEDEEFQSILLLASRDERLMQQLEQHFPADADKIRPLAQVSPIQGVNLQ